MGLSRQTRTTLVSALIAAPVGACVAIFVHPSPEALNGFLHSETLWRVVPGLAIYIAFSIYWDIAAKKAASLARSESRVSSIAHQLLIALSLLAIVLPVPGLRQRFLAPSFVFVFLGLVIELGGVAVAIWARHVLGSNWSRAVAITERHRLVREGPYARVRHPIYSGALLMYLGLAIAVGEVHALVGLALVCLAYWRKIAMEERLLSNTYGETFEQYKRASRSVIPFVI